MGLLPAGQRLTLALTLGGFVITSWFCAHLDWLYVEAHRDGVVDFYEVLDLQDTSAFGFGPSNLVLALTVIVVGWLVTTVVHEAGHAVAVLGSGGVLESVRLGRGPRVVSFRPAGVLVTWHLVPTGGATHWRAVPPSRRRTVVLAGPGATLLLGTACVVLAAVGPTDVGRVAVVLAVLQIASTLENLAVVQPRSGSLGSDGYQLAQLKGGEDLASSRVKLERDLAEVMAHSAAGNAQPALDLIDGLPLDRSISENRVWAGVQRAHAMTLAHRFDDAAAELAHLRASLGEEDPHREVVSLAWADALLMSSLVSDRPLAADAVTACEEALGSATPEHAATPHVQHTQAMLHLVRGEAREAVTCAQRSLGGVTDPRDRAVVDATIAIALRRAGDHALAATWAARVPPSCPLHAAATLADPATFVE